MSKSGGIERFWEWFVSNESRLREDEPEDAVIGELERHLFQVAEADWEIGPLEEGGHYLVLSSRKVDERDPRIEALINAFPPLSGWQVLTYKPPRHWQLELSAATRGGERAIDGKLWEFVLYRYSDETFDVLLKPDASCTDLDDDDLLSIATTLLDGELGERKRRQLVAELELVKEWSDEQQPKARLLEPGLLRRFI